MTFASRLVGREAEWARLDELSATGGLVTLTGPGGVGKTRLATEYASRTSDAVTVAMLATVPSGATPDELADALGYQSLDAATVALAGRGGIFVLDNCEHVLDAARIVAAAIRAVAGDAMVVVTSRQALGLPDEHVVVVEPLGLPAPGGADAEQSPAVALFLERATVAGAVLPRTSTLLADVAELCRRLDGLPLAIELAAARTRAVSPGDLLMAVDQRLDLLRRSPRPGDRYDSMRAAIEVSTSPLAPDVRTFFRRLGVFTGPFDLGLANAVAGGSAAARHESLDLLAGLVERSLVTTEADGPVTRYRLLELLREHALGELAAAAELAPVEEAFVEAMVAVADGIVANALDKWDPILLGAASSQFANLVRACELCVERDAGPDRAYRLLLPMFAAVHEGRPAEVWLLGERVRERWPNHDAPWRPEAMAVLATAAAIAGRHDDVGPLAATVVDDPGASAVALALADRAWGLAMRPHDPVAAARHFALAGTAADRAGFASMALEVRAFEAGEIDVAGDRDRALLALGDVLAVAVADDDLFVVVLAHLVRSAVHLRAGAPSDAEADLGRAEAAALAMGQPWWTAALLRMSAAVVACGPRGWRGATSRWRHAVDFAASRGALGEVAITLRTAASVAQHLGCLDDAAALYAAIPRSTAITVLPELFPESMAQLASTAPPGLPSGTLGEALQRARRVFSVGAEEVSPDGQDGPAVLAQVGDAELIAEGDTWRVSFSGTTVRVRDMKGIGDLAVLLGRPGIEVHALELMGGRDVGGGAGPVLDEQARRAYQDRIVELQGDIDEARADNDAGRAERAEVELDALVDQLSEAFGLGGRSRTSGSSAERARTAVTYRVRSAIRKLAQLHPDLGRHLTNAVRTGTWCSYRPERDVTWTIAGRSLAM